jgi:formylglycine-generating enzyme
MGTNPSYFKDCDNCPVESVSWDDVQKFINAINQKTGGNYRLPTEEEWEYAARGGSKSNGYLYSGSNDIGNVAWYYSNADSKTHPVGTKDANELGIHDMSGNVREWCHDTYEVYSCAKYTKFGLNRVYRSASYGCSYHFHRVSYRSRTSPGMSYDTLGFRLARTK